MDRRSFVGVTVMGGAGSLGASVAHAGGASADKAVVQKALYGMLSVQRRAWEQGVASQALLELGEDDLVVLMADEAVLRQLPDGRLAAGVASIAIDLSPGPAKLTKFSAAPVGLSPGPD